jgi:rubrerythrin
MAASDTQRFLNNLQGEIDGAALYRALAEMERGGELAAVYTRMAEAEDRHAEIWRAKLREAGVTDLPTRPGWRTQILIALARRFGAGLILPTVTAQERADSERYRNQPEARGARMAADERSHARLFRAISEQAPGLQGGSVARLEGRHRAGGGNALRAAVLGANDGLVSNASLVMGVAGAELAGRSILVTGLAGLMAGSLSMALGEWLSVQSARELFEHQIGIEREELLAAPEEEA